MKLNTKPEYNTNTNNTNYNFKNKIINFGYNSQSPSNLRKLVEEQNEKNYKKRIGKIVNKGKMNIKGIRRGLVLVSGFCRD